MKRLCILILLITIYACGSSAGNSREELEALNQSLRAFNQAFRDGNLQVLDSLTTEDYIHTNGNSKAFGKTSWFSYLEKRSQQINAGTLIINEYELIENEVRLYGTSAFITGMIITAGSNEGKPFTRQLRVSNFWVKDEGIWKRAAFHDTSIK